MVTINISNKGLGFFSALVVFVVAVGFVVALGDGNGNSHNAAVFGHSEYITADMLSDYISKLDLGIGGVPKLVNDVHTEDECRFAGGSIDLNAASVDGNIVKTCVVVGDSCSVLGSSWTQHEEWSYYGNSAKQDFNDYYARESHAPKQTLDKFKQSSVTFGETCGSSSVQDCHLLSGRQSNTGETACTTAYSVFAKGGGWKIQILFQIVISIGTETEDILR